MITDKTRDESYIHAALSLVDSSRVLKQGETFAVFDKHGDIQVFGPGEQGLYHEGTRFLSGLKLDIGGMPPLFLSSIIQKDNTFFVIDMTNRDIERGRRVIVERGRLHVKRTKFLWKGSCYEYLRICNFGQERMETSVGIQFAADFADIFEVRGQTRARRGRFLQPSRSKDGITLSYLGLDSVRRQTEIKCAPFPESASESKFTLRINLRPQEEKEWLLTYSCRIGSRPQPVASHRKALSEIAAHSRKLRSKQCALNTSSERFNAWLDRSTADLRMMTSTLPEGLYPYAGIPWFSTVFGRDGIIAAMMTLWMNPPLSRGVLAHLAAYQAKDVDPEKDAQPGKILHETRLGEMAALGEIPFGRYYGSVDATPLFVMLAGAYYERTGDIKFARKLWPNVEAALAWMDRFGDMDGDGFVEYASRSPHGLENQGWKDSRDSIFHEDGTLAAGPIALCEVQGYVFAAKMRASQIANALGFLPRAHELHEQAENLRRRFNDAFWIEELSMYAIALDGKKKPCRVRASNPGHCLFTQIAPQERARRIADALCSRDLFSGWGVRTLSTGAARYNPMSYHNGSVWPHDNAIIAAGLSAYGMNEHALKIFRGLFEASQYAKLRRLPELFCGFIRRAGEEPTLYPVACSPQAWSSAAIFQLLQAALGLTISGVEKRVYIRHPSLPDFLEEVRITNLRVGGGTLDLRVTRHENTASSTVLRKQGDIEVVSIK